MFFLVYDGGTRASLGLHAAFLGGCATLNFEHANPIDDFIESRRDDRYVRAACRGANLRPRGLSRTLNQVLNAMVKHDPSVAPLAPGFRYTENAEVTRPGEGFWKTVTALGKVQRRYLDPVSEQAVCFGQVEEGDVTNLAMFRVRVTDGKVTEGELVVGRKSDGLMDAAGFGAYAPPEKAKSGSGSSREAMIAAANSYFEGVQNHDGSQVLAEKGCRRLENGVLTAASIAACLVSSSASGVVIRGDCTFLEGFVTTISAVDHRRFPVVDGEARGAWDGRVQPAPGRHTSRWFDLSAESADGNLRVGEWPHSDHLGDHALHAARHRQRPWLVALTALP